MRVGDLSVDPHHARRACGGDRPIALTQKEYALLEYLVRHAGMAVTREQISRACLEAGLRPDDEHRRRVHQLPAQEDRLRTRRRNLVHTVRGVGYMLKATRRRPDG